MVSAALDAFGRLDVVVNNAGITRDRMLFNLSDEDWDQVVRVHLRGRFLLTRNAAAHWRSVAKEAGRPTYGRIVNTASEAFLSGSPGQANYAAAKAGIAALTLSAARGLAAAGVRANAICPRAVRPGECAGEQRGGLALRRDPRDPAGGGGGGLPGQPVGMLPRDACGDPTMQENGGGSIINAWSVEGLGGMGSVAAYCASRWAIRGMTKAAAHEVGRKGIRVNSIHPGMIDTPMT
jgi:NAD(P)-dependent dehydrogenase (short-subunit alcohol dehydrogenase family)